MTRFDYHKPKTLHEALRLKKEIPGSAFVAGGTDAMVKIKNKAMRPSALISLRAVPELQGISVNGSASIGGATTITDIVKHPDLGKLFPVLVAAAERLGSAQIRNVATIGGNLCNASPCADTSLPLLVLDASVEIQGLSGTREVALKDFFKGPSLSCLAPDEVLTAVRIPKPHPAAKGVFFKKGRVRMDLAVASLAAFVQMDGNTITSARFAAGSVAPTPLRLFKVENLVKGKPVSEQILVEAATLGEQEVCPICDVRSTDEYRRSLIGVFVRRAMEQLSGIKQP